MILKDRESIREFLKENGIKDLLGLQQVIKQMTGVLIEEILEAERDEFLGYQRYQRKDEKNGNSRNGYSQKRVRSSFGEIELKIPRDRKGEFEPKLIGKYQKDISQIEDSIISMKFPPIFGQRIKVESEGWNQLKLRGASAPHHLES